MSTTAMRKQGARLDRAARVQASIAAAVACPLCPEVTAETGLEILTKTGEHRWWYSSRTVRDRARELTGDPAWRERALAWIDVYREAHGHGPSWRTFWREPSLWPADATVSLLNNATRQLSEGGYLEGAKTPFGLRRRIPDDS